MKEITVRSAVLTLFLGACAEDINPTPPPPGQISSGELPVGSGGSASSGNIETSEQGDGIFLTIVDATDRTSDAFVYFDFESGSEIDPESEADSAIWDLRFQRFRINFNEGVVVATEPTDDFDSVSRAPETGYMEDNQGPPGLNDFVPWYDYDSDTNILTPTDTIFIFRSSEGAYFKIDIETYYDAAGTAGYPTFTWAEIDAPSQEAPEAGVMIDASSADAAVYFNVADGSVVTVADAMNSVDWDLAFRRVKIQTNSGTSGTGSAGALGSTQPYDEIGMAPADGFVVDEMLPVPGPPGSGEFSGNPVLADWFDYNPETNQVTPKDMSFVVRTADGEQYAKLRILAYEDGIYEIRTEGIVGATP